MTTDRLKRVLDCVRVALEIDTSDARDAYLTEACAGDEGLLKDVRSLLAEALRTSLHDVTRRLEGGIGAAAADALATNVPRPDRIGPYEVVDVLGEGGMGVVYRCRQSKPLERDVAVKVIRSAGSRRLVERFENERRALARLDHPNVAHVFDAGATDEGLPYVAMEYVDGPDLLTACDERALSIDERLKVLERVCDAVAFAHGRGVIHRDLKPSNILVAEVQGELVPKVIDFGIAKVAEEGRVAGLTIEGGLLGTLDYMSPEQAMATGEVDTRSDIYSLGVVLYELLTGALPFARSTDSGRAGLETARARVAPRTPSTQLSSSSDTIDDVARLRSTTGERLRRRVAGDLDWVVLKALEEDPDRRYATVRELAEDLRRARSDEPVTAAPPSARYRTAKFVRRNRVAVAFSAVAVLALVVGSVAATAGLLQARTARAEAEREAELARSVSGFLGDLLTSVRPDEAGGDEVTVVALLERAAESFQDGSAGITDPRVDADLRSFLGETYIQLSRFREAVPLLEASLEIRREISSPTDSLLQLVMSRLSVAHSRLGNLEDALRLEQEAAEIRLVMHGPTSFQYAASLNNVGNLYADLGRLEESTEMLQAAVEIQRRAVADDQRWNLSSALNNLATIHMQMGDPDEAIELLDEAIELRMELDGERSMSVLRSRNNLSAALLRAGRADEAEREARAALELAQELVGPDHRQTSAAHQRLAQLAEAEEAWAEAEVHWREMLRVRRAIAPDSWEVAPAAEGLAVALAGLGRSAEAEPLLIEAWQLFEAAFGPDHEASRKVAGLLAELLVERGDREAVVWAARAREAN